MNLYAKKQSFLGRKIFISSVILVALVIFLNIFQAQVRNTFFWASAPISKTLLASGKASSGFLGGLLSFAALNKENANLKAENQHLLAGLSGLQEMINADRDLKTAQETARNEKFTLLQAKLIGLHVDQDTMLIDRGLTSGIKENMPVISKEKVLFGRVSKVYADFSEVMLISSKKSALAVRIQTWPSSASPVYGIVKGKGDLSVYLDLIGSQSIIAEGDTLVTSAQEGIFPKELLVGKIESTASGDSGAFKTASIQPFFNPKNTDIVYIITDYLKK